MSFFAKALGFFTGGWIGPLVGVVALVGGLWFGYHQWAESLRQEGRDEVEKVRKDENDARALLAAAAAEEKRIKEKQHEMDIAKERAQREADGVAVGLVLGATRAQLERLRSTTATVTARAVQASASAATGPGANDPAAAIGPVFDECAGQLVGMAEQAEQLGIRLRGLQAWASSAVMVCGDDRPP